MKEQGTASEPLAIFIRNEETRCWEEKIINSPSRSRAIGSKALQLMKERMVYEYADTLLPLTSLALQHLLK